MLGSAESSNIRLGLTDGVLVDTSSAVGAVVEALGDGDSSAGSSVGDTVVTVGVSISESDAVGASEEDVNVGNNVSVSVASGVGSVVGMKSVRVGGIVGNKIP